MAPFLLPRVVVSGIKEKADALMVHGERLYVGTSAGNLHIYSIPDTMGDEIGVLEETRKGLARKSIEQLGFIKDINSLVLLSESVVTLYPLPTFTPPTPLTKAKGAFSFALHTYVQYLSSDGNAEPADKESARKNAIPTLMTQLVVGCRRKVVIYTWKDGEAQEIKEAPLPHSPRTISFLNQDKVCFGYSPTEYVIFSLQSLSAIDITMPAPATSSAPGMGALTGLTSYMTLGLGTKTKPCVVHIGDLEALITKDHEGLAIGLDGKLSRTANITWPAPPEEISYINPYILSTLPLGSVPNNQGDSTTAQSTFIHTAVIQIVSSLSLHPTQTLVFPFTLTPSTAPPISCAARLLTPSPGPKSPIFFVTTPNDRTAAATEGTSIWRLIMKPWAEQVDELVAAGKYADALDLLDVIDQVGLPDKEQRRTKVRALNAVAHFHAGRFDDAINTFLELDLNPAKVVALYPESIAGRLAVPPHRWIPLFGGSGSMEDASPAPLEESAHTASVSGQPKHIVQDQFHRSVETLLRYLSDRRPKVAGALSSVQISPSQSHNFASLSETSTEELFSQPNAPLTSLTPEQLVRFAQIVDTALYKSYLLIRPGLLGPLCRVANWCEVSEVEEELRARGKFAELIDLYNGKKMHAKALDLLRQLSDKVTDVKEKLSPSISYLQKLGPEHIQQVFDSSRWLFQQNGDMAFEIFTSEEVNLPRQPVADFLESISPRICSRYLEFLIEERKEEDPTFHDRLAELYLGMVLSARKRGDEALQRDAYFKLLQFLDSTHHYRAERLYGILSSEDLFEARAILLGRLGRHDQALEIYVHRLQDYLKAETYCKRVYNPGTETKNVFLTLLRIYLRPSNKTSSNLLSPALDLISRHSRRLDSVEVLQLLPPLVTSQDVRAFLLEALRAPVFDTRVIREISKARSDQLSRKLMVLQSKRVKVTDSRICPHCHKRIGNSVIAVHSPGGEVTHYQCREPFSHKLKEIRR